MTRRMVFAGVFTLASLAILIALGAWQWSRMGEKQALIAAIASRASAAPQPLPATFNPQGLDELSYRTVTLQGRFLHEKEAHVFFSLSKPVGGKSGPGYLIITPLVLADGRTILVNRGFVPVQNKDAATRSIGQPEGQVSLTGLIRLPEARNRFSGADDAAKNVFFIRDPAALAAAKGLGPVLPIMVDINSPAPPGGLPVPGVTQIDIPNNHFQYAMTWWSLAGVLAAIALLFMRQNTSPQPTR